MVPKSQFKQDIFLFFYHLEALVDKPCHINYAYIEIGDVYETIPEFP
jgi:hypothetical protein